MRRLVLVALLAGIVPCAAAQNMGLNSTGLAPGNNFGGSHHPHSFFPVAFFSDPFYSDAFSSTGYPVPSQPPVIIVQAPPSVSSTPEPAPPPTQSLMIELQGDHYVRVGGEEISRVETTTIDREPSPRPPQARRQGTAPQATTQITEQQLLPVVLIFRDGHTDDVSDYTIADGILYARANYYTDGAWNRKISLAALNLPVTQEANAKHNIKFILPSSPNEVVTRP